MGVSFEKLGWGGQLEPFPRTWGEGPQSRSAMKATESPQSTLPRSCSPSLPAGPKGRNFGSRSSGSGTGTGLLMSEHPLSPFSKICLVSSALTMCILRMEVEMLHSEKPPLAKTAEVWGDL